MQLRDAIQNSEPSANCPRGRTSLTMHRGEIFLCPQFNMVIKTQFAEIHAAKGALLALSLDAAELRVINCGGMSDVTAFANGGKIDISTGEELFIAARPIAGKDCEKADGIGRRAARIYDLGAGLQAGISDISIVSMLSGLSHLNKLKHPGSDLERKIASRLLKTALSLNMVTGHRGAYHAVPAEGRRPAPLRHLAEAF